MALHAFLFAFALTASFLLSFGAIGLGRRFRILDFPDRQRKLHQHATPRTGGLALFAVLGLGTLLACVPAVFPARELGRFSYALISSAALLCLLGLWDDKFGMRAQTKFLGQIAAVMPFVVWGRSTTSAAIFGWQVDFDWLALPLTVLWLVSCTNFVNLIDGLDGLAASVGVIAVTSVASLAWWHQQHEVLLLASVLAGALLGFLLHNWPPARLFLGDCGSMPLGFLVGALALEASAKKAAAATLTVPLVLLAVPMFDTSMAILRRKLSGRNIGQGDRQHLHHCLRDRGLSPTQALLAMVLMCSAMALSVVAGTFVQSDVIPLASGLMLVVWLVARRIFGFHEAQLLAGHVQAGWSLLRSLPRALKARFWVVRLKPEIGLGQPIAWEKAVRLARRAKATRLAFTISPMDDQGDLVKLEWTSEAVMQGSADEWSFEMSMARDDHFWTRVYARGNSAARFQPAALADLALLMRQFCENWPAPTCEIAQPRIVPGTSAPVLARRRSRQDPAAAPAGLPKVESDAA
jgi:UDP-GlcNAc:undecaprenyl-phosphate GlcNAc-1-phosphate transferase